MLWQEDEIQPSRPVSQAVVDLVFDMQCCCLPVDHAYALSQAVQQALPWFAQEPQAGLHLIHGAASSHGWQRPNEPDSLLHLSRRTKLTLRLPQSRITSAQILSGKTFDIAGYPLQLGKAVEKPMMPAPVLFARHIQAALDEPEDTFLDKMIHLLKEQEIRCRKALCGKTHSFQLPGEVLFTRSLMIADLTPQDSIVLQQQGLGAGRKIGCGLFVPYKDIKPVNQNQAETFT
jgi:CRISPR-associated protein Cas6